MVDYVVGIGGSSTMMIRDTGGWVEFWFQTGASTWNNDQQWSYFANGVYSGIQSYRLLRGGNWQNFGAVYVTYDQDVTFTIYGSGLGFPTYAFTHHIQRSTVPPPPNLTTVNPISTSTFHVVFVGVGDGGSPILEWQIGYGGSSNGPIYTVGSTGVSDIGGFTSGQRVYFWARGRNAVGWSGWSNRLEGTTWTTPRPPTIPVVTGITQTSMDVLYTFVADSNNPPTLERQIAYGKDPNVPTNYISADGITTISNLDPGASYYLWGRARNSVGWGAWSARIQVTLIAGARVLVGTEWKRAVPYVKDGGVWKVAEPWVKYAGIWRKAT